MQLDSLQRKLESIYEVQLDQRIHDYVITDHQIASTMTCSDHLTREQVLIKQEGADVLLSLYLDADVYDSFSQQRVSQSMCTKQAGDFCLAAEGVSHFMYLCWNANFEREVTHLELELQAEVDKYLLLTDYVTDDTRHHLHPWLFECWTLNERLNEEQQDRYENANRYAGKYCWGLEQRYLRIGKTQEMIRELRRFYRKTQGQKIRMIDTLNV